MIAQLATGVLGALLIGAGMMLFLLAAVPLAVGMIGGCAAWAAGGALMVWAVGW